MKVLSIGSDKNLFVGGSESQKRIQEYGKLFKELHIVVFTQKQTTDDRRQTTIYDNIWVYSTNSKSKFFYLWDAYKIGKSLVVSRNLSVISCQDPFESGLIGWFLKKTFGLPLQLQVHTDLFSRYFGQESLKNKLRVMLAKWLLPRADGIRVVSERIKNSLISHFSFLSSNVVVLPIFVDVKKIQHARTKINLREKYSDYDFIILMASRLTKEKNIGMAIEAMAEVVKSFPKTLLLIVGDGPELEELKAKSEKLKVDGNVIFESWTSDLVSYYKSADLFLLTSNYEGYGRTVVEAMAAGLPVVMTDVGLAGELIIDELDGIIVPVGARQELIYALIKLIKGRNIGEGLKVEALKLLETFSNKEDYLSNYRRILEVINKNPSQ